MEVRPTRSHGVAALMAILVVLSGCGGMFGAETDTPGDTATSPTPTDETVPTTTSAVTPTSTAEPTDGHDHTHATTETTTAEDSEAAMSGPMLLVIDGVDTHSTSGASLDADFWLADDGSHRWHASNESLTLADALAELGIDATAETLTYDGTTYTEENNGTTVSYRIDATPVEDPDSYVVKPDDEIFVTVHTENVSVPGRKYTEQHPHPHGSLNVTVEGESLDFTDPKYAEADDYFHFHEGGGRQWHGHSVNLTVAYAVSTLPDLELTSDSFTYDGTTYERGDFATTVNVTVNGEPVDPETYVLTDGDDVEIVVDE